jgi:hypothetical protein
MTSATSPSAKVWRLTRSDVGCAGVQAVGRGGTGWGVGSKAGVELQEIGRSRWAPTIFG